MRGSKILLALVAFTLLAAPLARAGDELGLPTDKTSGTTYKLVRFDGVVYRVYTEVSCEFYFQKLDNEHHLLTIKPAPNEPIPVCDVVIQWGLFPPVTLGLDIGGGNNWILGTETGYAEK